MANKRFYDSLANGGEFEKQTFAGLTFNLRKQTLPGTTIGGYS